MRVEIRIKDNDPAAAALRALPPRERAVALRALIRTHNSELGQLLGFRYTGSAAPTAPEPPVVDEADPEPAPAQSAQSVLDRIVAQAKGMQHAVAFGLAGLLAAAMLALAPVHSATAGTLDLNLTVASVHTEAWARHTLNQANPGLGAEYRWNRTWGLMGGEYLNSYRAPTWYAAGVWTPLHLGHAAGWHVDAGLAAGLATGYGHAWAYRGAWVPDHTAATGWRWNVTRHRYMRNPFSPLMAAGIARLRAGNGIGVNVLWVPNSGRRSSGFVGLQLVLPLRR